MPQNDSELKCAVIMVNLGTPDEATPNAVAKFLGRFLSDKRVVNLPRILWLPLLYCVILPLRSRRVAKLYQQIWLKNGSPLKVISEQIHQKVSAKLRGKVEVYLAMTYSSPDIQEAVNEVLKAGHQKVLLLPMYPQYSVSTTAPVFDAYAKSLKNTYNLPELRMVKEYYAEPAYIEALANSIKQHWELTARGEVLLFSFHGIPERYARNGDPYPQQCEDTAAKVAGLLGLKQNQWRLCYQSRFGKDPWVKPYTDQLLHQLAEQGVKSVDVISPAFSADCLETIEEVSCELRDEFLEAGGEQYHYISALNDNPEQVELYCQLIEKHTQGW
ncbi:MULTISPECIES: ferrochelatase [unclassified Agarivorans]|uniref:ferrochelatase n=1 Tax=unclassified Agarivorans TaxID=2636026 RepID=UPI0026E3FA8E|nr:MULTISPECIES: ferrochelatase [unclassified Agarivorans]MDO6684967.1 ferrochelatase [Agarivorans sp. 3_MG-2023]MDO6714872.1 ferrochelatase [Agarivorans sp. 2_MG-2023]MDO6765387.1 ferrochelatase [Agarivorans sp. 1_MG-2023]